MAELERKIMDTADKTGLGDIFVLQNQAELQGPVDDFDIAPVADPTGLAPAIDPQYFTQVKSVGEAGSEEQREKGLFEKAFGYNYQEDLPGNYAKMNPIQRAMVQAELNASNFLTRAGIGAAYQLKGTLQMAMPKSMEEALELNKIGTEESALEEDVYYERSLQNELKQKKSDGTITEDENDQLEYLNETLPSGIQRFPEFSGRVVAEVQRMAFAHHLFRSIPMPGGGSMADHLSDVGKRLLGKSIAAKASTVTGKYTKAALDSLAKQVEQLGPNVAEAFTWGAMLPETGESRVAEGAKMSAWAAVPVLVAPAAASASKTPVAQAVSKLVKRAAAKASAPVADKLAKMESSKAKKTFVRQALVEADDLYLQETGKYLPPGLKTEVKKQLTEIADETAGVAKKSSDEITSKLKEMSAAVTGKEPVGPEAVISTVQRTAKTAGDEVIDGAADLIAKRTGYLIVRQPNGKLAILDKANFHEVATNIHPKNLDTAFEKVAAGTQQKPQAHRMPKPRTKLAQTVVEEVELKRAIKRIQMASNDGYRAGAKAANEKAAIKLHAAHERLNTVRMNEKGRWENVEYARQIVRDFVPKDQQPEFMRRITHARTEGGVESLIDDVINVLDKKRVSLAVDGIRSALKDAGAKYSTKAGKFSAAPDHLRPILESLQKTSDKITKLQQVGTESLDDLTSLADEMIDGINKSLSGRGEVVGVPEGLLSDLYGVAGARGPLSTRDVEAIADLAKIVIHRTEQAGKIKINGVAAMASDAVDNSVSNIIPKKRPVKDTGSLVSSVKDMFGVESDHPATLITKMFGDESSAMKLLDDLYQGEASAMGIMRQSYGIIKDYMRRENISDDIYKTLEKKITINIGGKPHQVTRNDVLGLAMSTRDPWVFENLTKTRGVHIGGIDTRLNMSVDEIADAISKLSDDEMKFGGALFHLNNNYLSNVVNATSLELNGIKIATYPQYYPSHRVLSEKVYGNKYAFKTAETQSNFLPRVGGTAPIRINPYTKEMMSYIQNSSNYHGMSGPMRSLKTVMSDQALQDALVRSGYKKELGAFLEIVARSEGMYSDQSVIDTIGSGVINKFSKSVLGGRFSTVGTQRMSVAAAKSVIPGKHFSFVDDITAQRVAKELMGESDFFWHRWTGRRVSIELGDLSSTSSFQHFITGKVPLTEKPLAGLIAGDKQAIGVIHSASRRAVAARGLTGSKAEMAAVRLTEDATRLGGQPNWSVLTRSKLASDKGVFKRMFTMFRTALESQLNVVKRANAKFSRTGKLGTRTPADWRELTDSYAAVAESVLAVSVWKALYKHGRKAGIATVGAWLGYNIIDDNKDTVTKDISENIKSTTIGLFPLGTQIDAIADVAIKSFMDDGHYVNTSNDPISTVTKTAASAIVAVIGVVESYTDKLSKREGYTKDFVPVGIDDMMEELYETEQERKDAAQKFKRDVANAIVESAKATGLLTGLPVGPIDEVIKPSLKRSKFALVNKIDSSNSSNPALLARDLNKFLTEMSDLKTKEKEKGLTLKEAEKLFKMSVVNEAVKTFMGTLEYASEEQADGILDPLAKQLSDFYNN